MPFCFCFLVVCCAAGCCTHRALELEELGTDGRPGVVVQAGKRGRTSCRLGCSSLVLGRDSRCCCGTPPFMTPSPLHYRSSAPRSPAYTGPHSPWRFHRTSSHHMTMPSSPASPFATAFDPDKTDTPNFARSLERHRALSPGSSRELRGWSLVFLLAFADRE